MSETEQKENPVIQILDTLEKIIIKTTECEKNPECSWKLSYQKEQILGALLELNNYREELSWRRQEKRAIILITKAQKYISPIIEQKATSLDTAQHYVKNKITDLYEHFEIRKKEMKKIHASNQVYMLEAKITGIPLQIKNNEKLILEAATQRRELDTISIDQIPILERRLKRVKKHCIKRYEQLFNLQKEKDGNLLVKAANFSKELGNKEKFATFCESAARYIESKHNYAVAANAWLELKRPADAARVYFLSEDLPNASKYFQEARVLNEVIPQIATCQGPYADIYYMKDTYRNNLIKMLILAKKPAQAAIIAESFGYWNINYATRLWKQAGKIVTEQQVTRNVANHFLNGTYYGEYEDLRHIPSLLLNPREQNAKVTTYDKILATKLSKKLKRL